MALSTRAALLGRIAFIARIMRAARLGFRPCRMRATLWGRALRIARSVRIRLSLGLRFLNIVALLMVVRARMSCHLSTHLESPKWALTLRDASERPTQTPCSSMTGILRNSASSVKVLNVHSFAVSRGKP